MISLYPETKTMVGMEGGGEGMLAVVQGMQDASLAVTVMKSSHLKNSFNPLPVPAFNVSVETQKGPELINRGAQNGAYASSYQMAHCGVDPVPQTNLSEFPPQRLRPSRTSGNFEVGGLGSGETLYAAAPSAYRDSMAWPIKAYYASPNYVDPFVHSLRKYPGDSPDRSGSTDLVQRILEITQAKHLSRNSKSTRTVPERVYSKDKKIETTPIKLRNTNLECRSKEHDVIAYHRSQRIKRKRESRRKALLQSALNVHEQLSDTYNYLRARGAPWSRCGAFRQTDVRYLNDLRQYIKDSLRVLYDDPPVMCPQIQSRYKAHRQRHRECTDETCPDMQSEAIQACPPRSSPPPCMGRCTSPRYVPPKITKPERCCVCHKPIPCLCDPGTSMSAYDAVANEVFDWLKQLPVYADDSPANKIKRRDMVDKLAKKLARLKDQGDYDAKAKDEIDRCIEKLPLWYPDSKRDQEIFKNQIINDLFDRIKKLTSSSNLKDAVIQWLDEEFENLDDDDGYDRDRIVENVVNRLKPYINKPKDELRKEISNLTKELPIERYGRNRSLSEVANRLFIKITDLKTDSETKQGRKIRNDEPELSIEEDMMEWMNDFPELFPENTNNVKQNKKLFEDLAKKLKRIQEQDLDTDKAQEKMIQAIERWLKSIQDTKGENIDSDTKAKLVKNILGQMNKSSNESTKTSIRVSSNQSEDRHNITNLLENLTDIPEKIKENVGTLADDIILKLKELQLQNANENDIKNEIDNFIRALSKTGLSLSPTDKEEIAKNILIDFKSKSQRKRWKQRDDFMPSVQSEISDIINNIPNIGTSKRNNIKKTIGRLLDPDIQNHTDNQNTKNELQNILKQDANLSDNEAAGLATTLMNRVQGMSNPGEYSIIIETPRRVTITDKDVKQLITDGINETLQSFGVSANNINKVKSKLTESLMNNLTGNTDVKNDRINIMDELDDIAVPVQDALEITNKLIDKCNEILSEYYNDMKYQRTSSQQIPLDEHKQSMKQNFSFEEANDFKDKLKKLANRLNTGPQTLENIVIHQNKGKSSTQTSFDDMSVQDKAEEILDFLEDISGDDKLKTRKNKDAVVKLLKNLNEIYTHPDSNDKKKAIMHEITQFLRKISINTVQSKEKIVQKLASMLNSIRTASSISSQPKENIFYTRKRSTSILGSSDRQFSQETASSHLDTVSVDNNPKSKKQKAVTTQLFETDSNSNSSDIEGSMMYEVSPYIKRFSVDPDKTRARNGKRNEHQTSTPTQGERSASPRKDIADLSSIHPEDGSSLTIYKKAPDEEQKYMQQVKNILKLWLSELSDDLAAMDEDKKEALIKNLASSILERQKYFQLNPNATSEQDVLERLKYQVFRWLNNVMDGKDLSSALPKIEPLIKKLLQVNVPKLVKRSLNPSEITKPKEILNPQNEIKNEIAQWVNELLPNLNSKQKKLFDETVNDLADKIKDLKATNQESKIDNEISKWLDGFIKNVEELELKPEPKPTQSSNDTKQIVLEEIKTKILEWFDGHPSYQTEKMQDDVATNLIRGLDSVLEKIYQEPDANADALLTNEINDHLIKYPAIMRKTASDQLKTTNEILRYFKSLPQYQKLYEIHDKALLQKLKNKITDWINSLPVSTVNSLDKVQLENLISELAVNINKLRNNDKYNETDLKTEIKNFLRILPNDKNIDQDENILNEQTAQLIKNMSPFLRQSRTQTIPNQNINDALVDWVHSLHLQKGKTFEDIPYAAIDDFISAVTKLIANNNDYHFNQIKNILEWEITKLIGKVPFDPNVDTQILAESLYKKIKEVSPGLMTKPMTKKAADILFDNIENWCNSLPIEENTPEEKEKAKKIKHQIANNIIHKIGELNMNPDVFNDDFLYENILLDEIDNLLTDLLKDDLKNKFKQDFLEKMREVRKKNQEETAGILYKQQLKEAISNTLPSQKLNSDEEALFEVLKENMADAFVNLHYIGSDMNQKHKYKNKIVDEVNKFCNDYLKKYPASPLDNKTLCRRLYEALKLVSIPNEESMKNEVELTKIKDLVNEFIDNLSMTKQGGQEKLQINKIISVLAKKLQEIENERELAPEMKYYYDNKAKQEITKWLKKLPLINNNDKIIDLLADNLLAILKSTETSRRNSVNDRRSIHSDILCECPKPNFGTPNHSCCSCNIITPCTLSYEDQTLFDKIKKRQPAHVPKTVKLKDESISPFADVGSQTDVRSHRSCFSTCPGPSRQTSAVQTPCSPPSMLAVGSQAELCPHVIVKEYYWDTHNSSPFSRVPCAPHTTCNVPSTFQQTSLPTSEQTRGRTVPCPAFPTSSSKMQNVSPRVSEYAPYHRCMPQQSRPCPASPNQASKTHSVSPKISDNGLPPTSMSPRSCKYQTAQSPCSSDAPCAPRAQINVSCDISTPHTRPCDTGLRNIPPPCAEGSARKEWQPQTPQGKPESPAISSEDYEPGPSCTYRRPRVTRLGSLDDLPKSKCRRNEWYKFPKNEFEFWDNSKRRLIPSDEDFDEPFVKEKERTEEKVRCRCKERAFTKCSAKKRGKGYQPFFHDETINRCSQCCGIHCPHPSFRFFRQ